MGGSSGIGEATAASLLAAGARVTICGRDEARLAAARQRLGAVDAACVDGGSRAAVERLFAAIGTVDHLVLCLSGGKGAGPFGELPLTELRDGFEAKFWAHVTTAQAALPNLARGGSIVFVSAASARAALAGTAGLAAINGALEAMVRPLATELAPIRVNAVSPGVIDTPWWNAMPVPAKDAYFAKAANELPAGRVGKPEDVARAILMLVESPFITGTVIEVDGGVHLAR
jgi:NAD(P)-dependent dehydrogenase (short-subunit alcohol dehydrogenase family)